MGPVVLVKPDWTKRLLFGHRAATLRSGKHPTYWSSSEPSLKSCVSRYPYPSICIPVWTTLLALQNEPLYASYVFAISLYIAVTRNQVFQEGPEHVYMRHPPNEPLSYFLKCNRRIISLNTFYFHPGEIGLDEQSAIEVLSSDPPEGLLMRMRKCMERCI